MSASEGFNFRESLGYVTDPADTQFTKNDAYPKTANGVTFGWDSTVLTLRNRSTGVDARLAGMNEKSNNGTQRTFRVDLDNTGNHDISLALGQAVFNITDGYCQFKDNTTVISTVDDVGNTTGNEDFIDAVGTIHTSAANWVSNHVKKSHNFASTILRAIIAQPSAQNGNTVIAHLNIEEVAGAGIVGSSATTNANDTQSATGVLDNVGASSTTNAADTQAALGILDNVGTSATTNADDAHASTGILDNQGSSATTNTNDAQAAAGLLDNAGTSATTNADDTQAASGVVGADISGTSNTTNANDSSAASGILENSGTSITTNANDTQASSVILTLVGTSSTTNTDDTHAASVILSIVGTSTSTNNDDTQLASGTVSITEITGTSITINAILQSKY